ncbi:MAG: DNA-directed RNA polymerase subunit omega [Clostridia bacterium]|nr:DNA-directed RNA polymerase subunit omega [Clostridia bacterium]MBQ2111153.1 DNA-directed RNA polymerase subunit omega [Clostridia bacterium]MBQ2191977.1 DNA-directed RNA polymerase subunit omega [Clostridia bacterium]MBQ3938804.1 DNA-directed RNA polymerase subunit omega [Clostridia bacterium]MBQ5487344.1 DNA-directed RNA polymerase subunit omega [Clostridia bacterium]
MNRQMNHPPVFELEKKAGCRYMLVTTVAKRARQIMLSKPTGDVKPVAQAIDELYNDELTVKYPAEYFQPSEK